MELNEKGRSLEMRTANLMFVSDFLCLLLWMGVGKERERERVKGQWEKGREGMDRAEQGTKRIFNGSWNAKRYYCLLPARQYRVQKGSKRVRKIRKTIAFRGSVSLTGEMKDGVKGKSAAKAKRRRGMGYT